MSISENGVIKPVSAEMEEGGEGLDFIGFLRRRKAFVILLAVVGLGVGYLLFSRQEPQYRSDTLVQVIHRNSDPRVQTLLLEKDLSDANYVIRSEKILREAFERHNLGQLATFHGLTGDEAIARVGELVSTKSMSAAVIQISCTGKIPEDLRETAAAVAEEYLRQQRDNYDDAAAGLQTLLTKAKEDIHEKLKEAEEKYNEFMGETGLLPGGENPYRIRVQAVQQRMSSLELERSQLSSELSSLEAALESGGDREAIFLLVNKKAVNAASRPGGNSKIPVVEETDTAQINMAQALFPLMSEEVALQATVGEDHPKLLSIRTQIELTRKHLQELAGMQDAERAKRSPKVAPEPEEKDFLEVYVSSLRRELQIMDKTMKALTSLAAAEETAARDLMEDENKDRMMKNEIARLSALFDSTLVQINGIQMNSVGGVTAQVLSPANHGVLVYPVLTKFLGLGGFLGGFVGLFIGYLVEVADRSFRKPEDIVREFGLPIVGHVPFITAARMKAVPRDALMDKTVISVHFPRSRPAEAYRSVRTAICFRRQSGVRAQKLIQVTSPAAGDGKSTLAVNLAVSMAQSGKSTLLVESDFRRPKVHKLTGVSGKIGIVDVLRGSVEVHDAIKSTDIPGFFVMPCGSRPRDPAELLTRSEYDQLLQLLRDRYDVVIIDTPPILAVTDPCSVAPRVDAVIICMRLSRLTRELGRRALEQMRDVGANIAGIVVNGVAEREGYGYGNYSGSDYWRYYSGYPEVHGNEYGEEDDMEHHSGKPKLVHAVVENEI